MAVPQPTVFASNFDFDDYWQPYARFIEGKIVQVIKGQEINAQDESKNHLDFKDGHSIVIDLINDDIFEFCGDPYGPILDITDQDGQNGLSVYKGLFRLSNGCYLFVKLEFSFP